MNWRRIIKLFIRLLPAVGFAKTDVQPLINEGAAKEDIAASIFQAVVNQTIAGLAAGRKIKGKVAFLGDLYFHVRIEKTVC